MAEERRGLAELNSGLKKT